MVNWPLNRGNLHAGNVYPKAGCTWLVLNLAICVFSDVSLKSLRLRAHWLDGEASLVSRCPIHKDGFCATLTEGETHFRMEPQLTLNYLVRRGTVLERGTRLQRFVLAKGPEFLAEDAAEYLDAQICLEDWTGQEMVFPVVLFNWPTPRW